MPYDLVLECQSFRGICCLHLMGRREEEAVLHKNGMAMKKDGPGPGL